MFKQQTIYEKLWVVFEHGKKVFLFRCFVTFLVCGGWLCGFLFGLLEVLMVLWFVVCVFGKVENVLNMLFSAIMFAFVGVFYSCLFGFGRFSVRWGPKGLTSPNLSFFWCLCVSCFRFSFVFFCFFFFILFLFMLFWGCFGC